ncbi:elongation factor P hydroxylase [Pseudoteredinibacter isoporae]|uniref:elongation factor P hydroxylase n=1 Tax=Pseudoteredinibacter isoporae TaxID=570281 RepID=UPI00310BB40C
MSCLESLADTPHRCEDLIAVFNRCFQDSHNTVLIGGADEPLYQIADPDNTHHRIYFTRDYYASGLHEIAHWLVAGEMRRQQEDYGYWYAPDGRNPEQQLAFEQVEAKPQALECILARAAGFPFRVSADNAEAGLMPSTEFCQRIYSELREYCNGRLNERSLTLIAALADFYGSSAHKACEAARYCQEDIR